MLRIRSFFLTLALLAAPFLHAQNGGGGEAAAAPVPHPDILDRILGLVEPVPAEAIPHAERFREYALATVGPVPLVGEAAGAAIGQWMNTPKQWGQGWSAFGQRYWSNLAYNGIRQTLTYGGSVALREDTRYFASSRSGFWPRARHAVVSTFTARHPDGGTSFSYSGTAGVLAACAISSTWGPESWKGPGNMAENAGVSFASTAALNVVREFLPDIFHRSRN